MFPVERFTLSNGLRVIMSPDRSAPVVAVTVYYHAGSKNETPGRNGMAHLFEHLMFDGSEHVKAAQHRQILTEGGGLSGAFTLVDHTEFYNVAPSNYLETTLWLESDRMGFLVPGLTLEKMNIQRDVVNNERRQNYLNTAYGIEPLLVMPNVYPAGHPYSWRASGYETDLAKTELQDLKDFYTKYYVPNNAVLSIVGDIDLVQTRALVEKYFGSIPRGANVVQPPAPPVTLARDRRVVIEDVRGTLPKLTFIWPTGGKQDPDATAMSALSILLAGPSPRSSDRTARLSKLLIYDRQMATSVETNQLTDEQAGIFALEVLPREGVTLTAIESVVDSVLASLPKTPMTDVEILRLKNFLVVDQMTGLQSVRGKSETLATSELYFGNPLAYVKEVQRMMSVKPDDVQRAASRFLSKGRLIVSDIPSGKLEMISRPDLPYTNITPAATPAPK